MGNKISLEDEMINLRIVSKSMQRSAKKCNKNETAALGKLKKVRLAKWKEFVALAPLHSTHVSLHPPPFSYLGYSTGKS
jgi:hypothetical protein